MGKKLENYKKCNKDKIKIGSCIELFLLLENFYCDFERLDKFLNDNKSLLCNQDLFTLSQQFSDIKSVIINSFDVVLNDIDNTENYLNYLNSAY